MELHHLARHGLVSAAEARSVGVGPSELRALVRAGTLRRVIRGWYAVHHPRDASPPWEGRDAFDTRIARHRLLVTALVRSFEGRAVASHQSALVLHGIPLWRSPLDLAHLARVGDDHTRHRPQAVIHPLASGTTLAGGVGTVEVATAVVQVGLRSMGPTQRALPFESLVAADGALRAGLATREEIDAAVVAHSRHAGIPGVRELLRFADGRHESIGETRLAHALRLLGYRFRVQVEYAVGGRVFRVDAELEDEPVIIEFDGMAKYAGGRPDPTPEQVRRALAAEKWREDQLRSRGRQVARILWPDLDSLETIRHKVETARGLARLARPA